MRIIALDPGKVSGVAEYGLRHFWSDELPTWEAVEYVDHHLSSGATPPVDLIVCEAFVISARTLRGTRQYDALESIGALRYLAGRAGTAFRLITAAASKNFATDAKLKKLGWYDPSPGGHKNDAARVLLTAAVDVGVIDAARLLEER